MNLFKKIYLNEISKSKRQIVSRNKSFVFDVPAGYCYKYSRGLYQLFCPDDKSFLFQWQGIILSAKHHNEFSAEEELTIEQQDYPNAEIQLIGKYQTVCSATVSEDEKTIVYVWKFGVRNKRVLVTLVLDGTTSRANIDGNIRKGKEFIQRIEIRHNA